MMLVEKTEHTAYNVEVGHLVIIKSHKSPLLVWELGRITEVFPGPDGKVRVVNIHTSRGTIKRPITQIYVLPQQHKQFESLLSTRGVCSRTHERVWPVTCLVSKRTVCSAHIIHISLISERRNRFILKRARSLSIQGTNTWRRQLVENRPHRSSAQQCIT